MLKEYFLERIFSIHFKLMLYGLVGDNSRVQGQGIEGNDPVNKERWTLCVSEENTPGPLICSSLPPSLHLRSCGENHHHCWISKDLALHYNAIYSSLWACTVQRWGKDTFQFLLLSSSICQEYHTSNSLPSKNPSQGSTQTRIWSYANVTKWRERWENW